MKMHKDKAGHYKLRDQIQVINKEFWPTPRSNERGSYQYDRGNHSKPRVTLTGAVKRWPTPTTPRPHDNERTVGKYIPSQNQKDLVYAVAHDFQKENTEMEALVTGQLNPTWVCWLMGYPLAWTDLRADYQISLIKE